MPNGEVITKAEIANFYRGKKILIIGGTGSVGESMVEMLLGYEPKVIRIFSRDEFKQYQLANKYGPEERRLRYLLGDVRDYERIEKAANNIDIIFNLAALKHVPACEYNPFEAVKTNVIGTQNVINAAISCGASSVVLTSSDKAIGPTNAMGATKLLGERLMIAAEYMKGGANIAFSAVRFGNVMGSRGSVVPFFIEQILKKGCITVTDPSMTRFMMSLSNAVSLTIMAAAMAKGGEIFVLKMPNIKIDDLVEALIELACEKHGLETDKIKRKEIGLRVGEKMYEELMTEYESRTAYDLEDMYAILPDGYKHLDFYEKRKKAEITNYASNDTVTISRDEIKKLLISEKLI